jgi:RNA polymerase sigma factor (TIGR02999 family)
VRRLLDAANRGDHQAAADLLPLVYAELHKLAAARLACEKPGQTLTATALVHEAYLRLIAPTIDAPSPPRFDGMGHFFAAAAEAIRRILVENVRRKKAAKNGGRLKREELHADLVAAPASDDELLLVNEALDRLAEMRPEMLTRPQSRSVSPPPPATVAGDTPAPGWRARSLA